MFYTLEQKGGGGGGGGMETEFPLGTVLKMSPTECKNKSTQLTRQLIEFLLDNFSCVQYAFWG